jgi:hypothetical protein
VLTDEAAEEELSSELESLPVDELALGEAQQSLLLLNLFAGLMPSCNDPSGTNSVMASMAVASAKELGRWQPTKDFQISNGRLQLTATGKAQCADGKCWNTQALLDLQSSPTNTVQVRPGVKLDSAALRNSLTASGLFQVFNLLSFLVPAHKFTFQSSTLGGCDTYHWFKVTKPDGTPLGSSALSSLEQNLLWVSGKSNPYIGFSVDGTSVGIDPTYGLNETGVSSAGACTAACTKVSTTDLRGQCCACNGTKKYARSAWNVNTYLCQ